MNHSDPSECFVLFAPKAPISEIYGLNEEPSWVGAPMLLSARQPCASIYNIANKLLEDKALEEGEDMSSSQLNLRRKRVLKAHSPTPLPKRKLSQ